MAKYLLKRTLMIFLIVLCVTFVLFALMYALPASRIQTMPMYGGGDALDAIFALFNASDNMMTKFIRYVCNILFRLDFGRNIAGHSLYVELSRHAMTTLILVSGSVVVTLLVGIPIGMYAAVRKDSKGDRAITVLSLLLSSIPPYTLALLIAIFFVLYLGLLPILYVTATPAMYAMPVLTIALGAISSIARMTRTSMLEVLEQPFITALYARGLSEANVICRHAFKNALTPVLSVMGGFIAQMLCGAFVVEHFFNIRGLGFYILRSVSLRNHYEVLGSTVMITVMLAALNIVIDLLYALVNPKIRLRFAGDGNSKPEKQRRYE